jgi:type III secretion protein J
MAPFRALRTGPVPARVAAVAQLAPVTPIARLAAVALGAGALACAGCAVPVAAGLDDAEANRVVVALEQASVDAEKEPDPGVEGKWRVLAARDDVAQALGILQGEELPRHATPGVLDAVGKGSLVPSEAAERAQLVAGIAGDLQRSLEGVDGVLSARVHLSLPDPGSLRATGELVTTRGSASVLVEHRGATPPLSADSVQRLVAGAVAGLLPTDVVVVMIPRPAPPGSAAGLAHVGPIAVARASMRHLQAALVSLVALVALLAGATLVLYTRLQRALASASPASLASPGAELPPASR